MREALLSGSRFVLHHPTLHGKSVRPLPGAWATACRASSFAGGRLLLRTTSPACAAFSTDCLGRLMEIGGQKYDYEMNVLPYAPRGRSCPSRSWPIETVYLDGNQSSHFDSAARYAAHLSPNAGYGARSALAWLLHVVAILLLSLTLGWHFLPVFHPAVRCGQRGAELLLQPFSGLPPRALCLCRACCSAQPCARRCGCWGSAAASCTRLSLPLLCRMAHRLRAHRSAGIFHVRPTGPWWSGYALRRS